MTLVLLCIQNCSKSFFHQKLELYTNECSWTMKTSTTRTITWQHWKIFQQHVVKAAIVPMLSQSNFHPHTMLWRSSQTYLGEWWMKCLLVKLLVVSFSVATMKMFGTPVWLLQPYWCQSCLQSCCSWLSLSASRQNLVVRGLAAVTNVRREVVRLLCSFGCTIRTEFCAMIYPSSRSMIHVCKLITAAYASVTLNRSLYSIVELCMYKINVILSQRN